MSHRLSVVSLAIGLVALLVLVGSVVADSNKASPSPTDQRTSGPVVSEEISLLRSEQDRFLTELAKAPPSTAVNATVSFAFPIDAPTLASLTQADSVELVVLFHSYGEYSGGFSMAPGETVLDAARLIREKYSDSFRADHEAIAQLSNDLARKIREE